MSDRRSDAWRHLALVLVGFLTPAAAVVLLQIHPSTGVPLSYLVAPWWAGMFLHLMLLVIAVLALIGEVPRWALVVPVAVWLVGICHWWIERSAIRERAKPTAKIELNGPVQPLVLRFATAKHPPTALANALVSVYALDAVYAGQYRFRVTTGKECSFERDTAKLLQPYQPRYLAETEQCIVRERMETPPGGIEVIVQDAPAAQRDLTAFKTVSTRIDIATRGGPPKTLGQFDVLQQYAPMPLLWPVLGCLHIGNTRSCRTDLMRWPLPVDDNPDRARTNAPWLDNNAYYVAAALGLEPRKLKRDATAARVGAK